MMNTNMQVENDRSEVHQLELANSASEPTSSAQTDEKREALMKAVSACELNTVETRVAWLMNHFPNTRDSDLA
jgi:hypothetical protein